MPKASPHHAVWSSDLVPIDWDWAQCDTVTPWPAPPCRLNRSQLSNLPATATLLKQSENPTGQTVAPRRPQASAHTGPACTCIIPARYKGTAASEARRSPDSPPSCLSCPASLLQAQHTAALPLAPAERPDAPPHHHPLPNPLLPLLS